jgi:hypothetical protein
MNFFGQSETNKQGFDKIQDRFYSNRWGYAQRMVDALREFVKFPLPQSEATSAATNNTNSNANSKKVVDTTSNKGLVAMLVAAGLALAIRYVGTKKF